MNAASWLEGLPAPAKWRELLLAHGPRIATWTLSLALGVQAAIIVTDLVGASRAPLVASSAPVGPAPGPAARRGVDIAAITASHLFGAPKTEPTPVDAANAPQTSMPLVLSGTIAGEDPRRGLAILGSSASSAKVYAVNDSVPGGARLHSVYSDRVLLERNGRLESLALPRQGATAGRRVAPPPPPVASAPASNPAVERMREMVTNDPGVISEVIRPQAVYAQGKLRGFRVYPGRNRQAFMRLGLRPGDVVTAVNGTPLDDPARSQEIFQTISSSSQAQLSVMRNGRQEEVTLDMTQLASEAEQLIGGSESAAPTDQASLTPAPPEHPPAQEAGTE